MFDPHYVGEGGAQAKPKTGLKWLVVGSELNLVCWSASFDHFSEFQVT